MSSTILMVIVLVVMWLVVLVPMFVHRHEDEPQDRPVDEPATATRVLTRRSAVDADSGDPVDSVDSADPARAEPLPAAASASASRPLSKPAPPHWADGSDGVVGSGADSRHRLDTRLRRPTRARMLARRRRTLISLVALVGTDLIGATLFTPTLWLAEVPAAVMLVGFVGWLRVHARHEHRWYQAGRDAAARDAAAVGHSATSAAGGASRSTRPAQRHAATADGRGRESVPAQRAATGRTGRPLAGITPAAVPLDDDAPTFVDVERRGGRSAARRQAAPYGNVRHLDDHQRRRAANE